MQTIVPASVTVLLVILCAGCHNPQPKYTAVHTYHPGPPPSTTPAYQPTVTASELQTASDQELATSVRNQFDRYGDLSGLAHNIHIVASSGVVTLTGSVPTEKDRQMVDALVRNNPGVMRLNNSLHVAGPTGTESSRVYSTPDMINLHVQTLTDRDWELAHGILTSLRTGPKPGDVFVPVDVYIADGKATLRGTVKSEEQRQTIITAVQRAAGTENVQSELVVKP